MQLTFVDVVWHGPVLEPRPLHQKHVDARGRVFLLQDVYGLPDATYYISKPVGDVSDVSDGGLYCD